MSAPASELSLRPFSSPLWCAGFRPFYLLGAGYGVLLMLSWLAAYAGLWLPAYPLRLWHGHEMVFGFAGGIVSGFFLTALPSWAGTREIRGGSLALLVAVWVIGRIAMWFAPVLPAFLVAGADSLVFLLLALMVTPDLVRAEKKAFLAVLPILAGLFCGALAFHLGAARHQVPLMEWALRLGLFAILAKFVLAGGYLTRVFTANAMREKGAGEIPGFHARVEALAIGSAVAFMVLDLAGAAPLWRGSVAAVAAVAHLARLKCWRGWQVRGVAIVSVMHVAFLWLVISFGLAAASDLGGLVPAGAWLHAFTVGALGLMMMALLSRVTLRHTGRPLVPPKPLPLAYGLMFGAAVLRSIAAMFDGAQPVIAVSSLMWTSAFAIYLAVCAAMLVQPSVEKR